MTALNSQVESEQSRIAQLEKEIKALKVLVAAKCVQWLFGQVIFNV